MKRFNVTNLYYLANMKYPILAVMAILITSCGGYKTEKARPVDSCRHDRFRPASQYRMCLQHSQVCRLP